MSGRFLNIEIIGGGQPAADGSPTPPVLGDLSLSGALVSSTASSGAIIGATDGSTITADLVGLTVDSAARSYAFDGSADAGAVGELTEALADAANSPNVTMLPAVEPGQVIAPMAPGYLASVSTAPTAAYGAQRVFSSYSGPLFQLVRASDSATMDVSAQAGGDYPDYDAIETWADGSALTVATIYDQTGNGLSMTQATVANQPSFDLSQKFGNVVPILIDGYGRSSTNGLPQAQIAKTMSVGRLSLDLISNSIFMTVAPKVSYNGDAFLQGTNDAVSTAVEEFSTVSGGVTVRANSSNATASNGAPRASIDTIGFTTSATALYIYDKGAVRGLGTTRTSTAIPRLTLGSSISGGTFYNGMYRLFGMVVYPTALSNTTDGPAVVASMNTAFAQPTSYDYTVLFTGDSIMEGSGGAYLRNVPSWLEGLYSKRVEYFNTGVHGQTLGTDYSTRTKAAALYRTGVPNVAFVEASGNDLGAGAQTGSSIYTNSTIPYVAYLQGLGYKVVVCTTLPSPANYPGSKETERLNYNALVRANSAGADYVLDVAAHPVMGDAAASTSDTTLWTDQIHPTALGYRWLAGAPSGTYTGAYTYYYALQQMLGVTP